MFLITFLKYLYSLIQVFCIAAGIAHRFFSTGIASHTITFLLSSMTKVVSYILNLNFLIYILGLIIPVSQPPYVYTVYTVYIIVCIYNVCMYVYIHTVCIYSTNNWNYYTYQKCLLLNVSYSQTSIMALQCLNKCFNSDWGEHFGINKLNSLFS